MPQVPGNTISGAGGYGSYPGSLYHDRYDWIVMPGETPHLAASAAIGIIARNPVVSVVTGVAHAYWHLLSYAVEHADHDHSSPGGGGPGLSPISTNPPPSLEATGASLAQPGKSGGPASSSKRRSRPRRKKCPKGYHWSKYLRMCIRDEPEIRLSTRRKY